MKPAHWGLVVLVIAVVALAIYFAMRPSAQAAATPFGADAGATNASQAIASIGGSAVGFASSIAQAAG